ncbi:unnamed protein product [Paramecium sonneborni]|uniref:Uncharacterized protein n=1 Tax=Paramecium sonneborni TaxID=65129 RepID=A0A8S1M5X3_9CILI|nr:unnamed protein product [Paramecium sonneborni]
MNNFQEEQNLGDEDPFQQNFINELVMNTLAQDQLKPYKIQIKKMSYKKIAKHQYANRIRNHKD